MGFRMATTYFAFIFYPGILWASVRSVVKCFFKRAAGLSYQDPDSQGDDGAPESFNADGETGEGRISLDFHFGR